MRGEGRTGAGTFANKSCTTDRIYLQMKNERHRNCQILQQQQEEVNKKKKASTDATVKFLYLNLHLPFRPRPVPTHEQTSNKMLPMGPSWTSSSDPDEAIRRRASGWREDKNENHPKLPCDCFSVKVTSVAFRQAGGWNKLTCTENQIRVVMQANKVK